jgi:hypothetical protein
MIVAAPEVFNELLTQIRGGSAILFLGSGSTRNCRQPSGARGLTGLELAKEILAELSDGAPAPFEASLMEAAEYYTWWKAAGRAGLDRYLQSRLRDLQPTLGHYLAATFPWRAIITTNYNEVSEDAWRTAHATGFSSREALVIRTDDDIERHAGDASRARIYKPHGCITIHGQQQHRMVITSQDYFESESIRPKMYQVIRDLARECTTLFVGYSMTDFTFRNIYYRLYADLGSWAVRSYSVNPAVSDHQFKLASRSMDKSFNTTLVDDGFDTFMVRLSLARGSLSTKIHPLLNAKWGEMVADSPEYSGSLALTTVTSLPGS